MKEKIKIILNYVFVIIAILLCCTQVVDGICITIYEFSEYSFFMKWIARGMGVFIVGCWSFFLVFFSLVLVRGGVKIFE